MNELDLDRVRQFVNTHIDEFHLRRIGKLQKLNLRDLLRRKNPYLFRAKNIVTANELIEGLLDASLSSSEEEMFGQFLEDLAIFVAETTCDGRKSAAPGVDLELIRDNTHFVISIKSGTSWGNSSQHKRLAQDLQDAVIRLKQSSTKARSVQSVLGICYGRTKTVYASQGYLKVVGQNFWSLIGGNKELYVEIIEPLGYRAKEHNEVFLSGRSEIVNKFTGEFIQSFCERPGAIDWRRVVEFNSKNFDLDEFGITA